MYSKISPQYDVIWLAFVGAVNNYKTTPFPRFEMHFQLFKLPNPPAPLPMIAAFDLQLVDLTPQPFVDHVMEFFSLGSAVRTALFALPARLALPSEPLVQTRLAKVLAAAYG